MSKGKIWAAVALLVTAGMGPVAALAQQPPQVQLPIESKFAQANGVRLH